MFDMAQSDNTASAPQIPAARPIYLDHNASAPVPRQVAAAMQPFLTGHYGNPSSSHWAATPAKAAIEDARAKVAFLLGCAADEIIFTSGGTEGNNMALKGTWFSPARAGNHIISSAIEHDAVLKPLRFLRSQGAKITLLPVDKFGRVNPEDLRQAITPETALISIMHANNETGTIQPIGELAAIARAQGIPFHTDAAQSVGKIPVKVRDLGVDMLSCAGHKFGAPNGIGAFYLRKGHALAPLLLGGGHEAGRRAGTESAVLAAGLGAAAALAASKSTAPVRDLRDYFWAGLQKEFGARVTLNGHRSERTPNTLNISFTGHIAKDLLALLPGVAATTGSACHAGCVNMSHVLIAMGVPMDAGLGAIRFSLGAQNTRPEIDHVIALLKSATGRKSSNITQNHGD